MKWIQSYLAVLPLFLFSSMQGQNLGNHPSEVDWMHIDSQSARIIYPSKNEKEARRIADVVQYMQKNGTTSIGNQTEKIDIVLQTQQVISNGFVTLAPFRSEFFGTAPQNFARLGSTDWLDLLAIHEYRHVLQYTNAKNGATKLMHLISGESGWAGVLGLRIPTWYFEGDAVLAETLFSKHGRGRTPSFFKEQRALLLQDKIYAYNKARNGSFKDLVPSHYPLGFVIMNHLRNHYGIATGKNILFDAGKRLIGTSSFSYATKKHTGRTSEALYDEAYQRLQVKFKKEAAALSLTPRVSISSSNNILSQYLFPEYTHDSAIVCLKTSLEQTPRIVLLKNGKETKLTNVGVTSQDFLSLKKDNLAWTEYQRDLRRGNQNYSNIVGYNLRTKQKKTLTKKGKFFSPQFAHNGKQIIAVEANENLENRLVVIDASTGTVLTTIPNPQNHFLSFPKWGKQDRSAIFLARYRSKIAFFQHHFQTHKTQQLTAWTEHTIGSFTLSENTVVFSASFSGIDNIYSFELDKPMEIKQLTSVKVGAYMPTVGNSSLAFSEFTANGHVLSAMKLSNAKNQRVVIKAPVEQKHYDIKTTKEESNILEKIPQNNYFPKPYKGLFKGMKFHSWGLISASNISSNAGLNLKFQNILTDFSANGYAYYNVNEKRSSYAANLTYSRYFLEINAGFTHKNRSNIFISRYNTQSIDFSESQFSGGISIPLSRIHGNYFQSLRFETKYVQHKTADYTNIPLPFAPFDFGAIETEFTLSNIRQTALQNLAPKFGQYLNISYKRNLKNTAITQWAAQSILFFPGFSKNHSTQIISAWQKENTTENAYQFENTFANARGYDGLFSDASLKVSMNYTFPIAYPDWGLKNIAYFKRIRGTFFYDYSQLMRNEDVIFRGSNNYLYRLPKSLQRNSYGAELIFDNIFFNLIPIPIGLRQSYLLDKDLFSNKSSTFELFLRIGF
jgi:hypothetical protein